MKQYSAMPFVSGAQLDDIHAAVRYFGKCVEGGVRVCIPAAVAEYDRASRKAKVMPLVKTTYVDQNGAVQNESCEMITVPVRLVCHGGFVVDAPLFVGDTGWIVSSDVDTSILRQSGNEVCTVLEEDKSVSDVQENFPQKSATGETHAYGNGFFIPDCWAGFDATKVQMGGEAGKVGEKDLYVGESAPGTYSENGGGAEVDGLASIVVSKGDGTKRITVSIGKDTSVSVEKGKITLQAENITVRGEVTFEGQTTFKEKAALPQGTTLGGEPLKSCSCP